MKTTAFTVFLVLCAACGDDDMRMLDGGPILDGSVDGAVDGSTDGSLGDAGPDSGADVGPGDAGSDAMPDSMTPDVPVDQCTDGRQSGDETDVDCGGETCEARCEADLGCTVGDDCTSSICISGTCQPSRCTDGIQNGAELGPDCGGGTCPGCPVGNMCVDEEDCDESGDCSEGFCQSSHCFDEIRNSNESDVDCGGSDCAPCVAGQQCALATDCSSGTCTGGFCLTELCLNGVLDEGETNIDCGGGDCPGCSDGEPCALGEECLSDRCEGDICTSCADGMMTGDEAGVDCGGATCAGCSSGAACTMNRDCASNVCEDDVCVAGSRSCLELLQSDPSLTSGTYEIQPDPAGPSVAVYCDMTTDGGGWTLVAASRDEPLIDQAGSYHAELANVTPTTDHTAVWDGMRALELPAMDIRFACRRSAAGTSNDVDLSFYGNDWYDEITSAPLDADTCFADGTFGSINTNMMDPQPERRNNLTAEHLDEGAPWVRTAGFEGEDSCGATDDFTVDFNAGGMDQTTDTDWGEDDGTALCGTSSSTGVWLIYVREALCSNGELDPGEAAIDCGGACGPCPDGTPCTEMSHCAERCEMNVCTSCQDGLLNGDEFAIDCGGSCGGCPGGTACTMNDQCATNECELNVCTNPAVYFENFDSGANGWTSSGLWELGTPANDTINTANSAPNAWMTDLDADYPASVVGQYLESPPLDLTGSTDDPVLSFAQNFVTENCCDEGWLEMSIDGGATYARVLAAEGAVNWYDDLINNEWDGTSDGWRQVSNVLTGAAGNADVRLRFYFSSDSSFQNEGFAIDDVRVGPSLPDLRLEIRPSATACSAADIRVTNIGTAPATRFDLEVSIDGGAAMTDPISGLLAPGATFVRTVTGDSVTATALLGSDPDVSNNSASLMLNAALAGEYQETFEMGAGGWQVVGTNPSWALGVPSDTAINSPDSPVNAWVTNLSGDYNNNEVSSLVSPCFDFGALATDPTFSFAQIFRLPSTGDHVVVELSIDGGGTWAKLGAFGSGGMNWYNDLAGGWWDGTSSAGAGEWRRASHVMTGTANESEVRVRFTLTTNATTTNEGFGVDDVVIAP